MSNQGTESVRTCVVIGASRGIGAAVASRYLSEGFAVAGTYRGGGVPDGVLGLQADMRDPASLEAAVKSAKAKFGRLDACVVCAGAVRGDLLVRMTPEAWHEVLDTNLTGAVFAARAALKAMSPKHGGSLVLVASDSAMAGIPGASHYTAAKAGLIGFMRSAMWEYGSRDVRINTVAPGLTDTDMGAQVSEENRADVIDHTPLGRSARPEEIAEAIFQLSQLTFVTGAVLPVTGGAALGL